MNELIEDFLQYLRNERGQSEQTQKTYAGLLQKFIQWAEPQKLRRWEEIELSHLTGFLLHEQRRQLANQPENSSRRLSTSSVYHEIAALRAFYRFAESEKLLPRNAAENLSLPRRWKRLPKALTGREIEKLLAAETLESPRSLCDQAILEM